MNVSNLYLFNIGKQVLTFDNNITILKKSKKKKKYY